LFHLIREPNHDLKVKPPDANEPGAKAGLVEFRAYRWSAEMQTTEMQTTEMQTTEMQTTSAPLNTKLVHFMSSIVVLGMYLVNRPLSVRLLNLLSNSFRGDRCLSADDDTARDRSWQGTFSLVRRGTEGVSTATLSGQ
jgi:hypothetical protein